MAVQMPLARLLLVHRLLRTSTSGQRRLRSRDVLRECRRETRTLSTFPVKRSESKGDGWDPSPPPSSGRAPRPLSPLERLSRLLPQDALSPEVSQLRDPEEDASVAASVTHGEEAHGATPEEGDRPAASASAALPGESSLAFGELLVAEHRKKGRVEFRKMFELRPGALLQSNWGVVAHDDAAGRPAGCFMKTSRGVRFLVRRASLEDYVLYMKRGPAIAYPKVWGLGVRMCSRAHASSRWLFLIVSCTPGRKHNAHDDGRHRGRPGAGLRVRVRSHVFVPVQSRFGCKGSVLSLEVREDHHRRAVLNYKRWRESWSLRRGEEWPDNVQFHIGDLGEASSLLATQGFHAVALDLIHPHLVLPTVVPHLHPGAVCAVYLANITQVIDLLEGLRCLPLLPLLCERIIEVPVRDWVVAPALQKDGSYCVRKAPAMDRDRREEADREEQSTDEHPAFGSVPYIARPHPEQMSHTAFLVKLRKYVR
ncbi:tRNA (adenine(58)-N(1))-methyltransferase, mitochondrial isoform X1 [Cyclopterus lumpus]|uniref:tRNA (adenine(58)-N(1))-methyltransferase, mitochondrial isoform X1 n=1 Tax=Cyclopterus lumpus TaxID=8103 RepID=UPI00148752E9|nr:tRNA (adenine(58)-N(1))-methyltransferase, mitochondrial isoform X1 [Cyclopterus lumpus]